MKYWILSTFLLLSALASNGFSTKKIISRQLHGLVGEYAGDMVTPKMKLVAREWSTISTPQQHVFPNDSGLNLIYNLESEEFTYEDPDNLLKDLPQGCDLPDEIMALMRNKRKNWADEVFDLLSGVHADSIPPRLRRSPFVAAMMLSIAESVDVERKNPLDHTPLMIASGVDGKSVSRLLERGADVHAMDATQFTPLHHAAYFGVNSACKVLLKHGADVNACESHSSALKEACRSEYSNAEVVLTLLNNGASFTVLDRFDRTPLQAAEYYLAEDDERIRILREAEQKLILN